MKVGFNFLSCIFNKLFNFPIILPVDQFIKQHEQAQLKKLREQVSSILSFNRTIGSHPYFIL